MAIFWGNGGIYLNGFTEVYFDLPKLIRLSLRDIGLKNTDLLIEYCFYLWQMVISKINRETRRYEDLFAVVDKIYEAVIKM